MAVVLEKKHIDARLGENGLCHRIVGAIRHPRRSKISPAKMHGNGHISRTIFYRIVHHRGVAGYKPVRIHSLRMLFGADLWVAQVGEKDIVHLQITTAGIIEGLHRFRVCPGNVGKQCFVILVFVWANIF